MPEFPYETAIVRTPGRFSTVADNQPKNLPGCYGIFDTQTGHWYIGRSKSVQARRIDHELHHGREEMVLHEAIVASGCIEDFIFCPLYYMVPERVLLIDAEETLIESFNSVSPNGYNQIVSYRDPAVWQRMRNANALSKISAYRASDVHRDGAKVWLHTDEVRAKRNKTLSDPDVLSKRNDRIREALNRPESKARLSEAQRKAHTPAAREKRSASIKAHWEKRRAAKQDSLL